MLRYACTVAFLSLVSPAFSQTCASVSGDPLAGFTPLDPLTYLDLPERDVVSVTSPIETAITSQIIAGTARTASKTWCQIGIQQMVVDFEVPVEDDAIRAIITRAVYEWNAQGEPIGWQLDQLGERPRCARGDDPFASICP